MSTAIKGVTKVQARSPFLGEEFADLFPLGIHFKVTEDHKRSDQPTELRIDCDSVFASSLQAGRFFDVRVQFGPERKNITKNYLGTQLVGTILRSSGSGDFTTLIFEADKALIEMIEDEEGCCDA